ncbi:MAG: enolase C-terminal domain-like protein, partial [Nitrososphaeraceae archaeon]
LNNDQAVSVVAEAIENSGLKLGKEVGLGIDFASSSLWDSKKNHYNYARQGLVRNTEEQIDFAEDLMKNYHLIYAEDPVHEDDFESMARITEKNKNCLVTGDDMLVTNAQRVIEASNYGACSGAILKVNQAGTLNDALDFAESCTKNNIKIITSHRSGESVDAHIAHIALATSSKMIKTGVVGGERVSKLNELLRLSEYDLIKGMMDLSFN